jgi:hypothetical protein
MSGPQNPPLFDLPKVTAIGLASPTAGTDNTGSPVSEKVSLLGSWGIRGNFSPRVAASFLMLWHLHYLSNS